MCQRWGLAKMAISDIVSTRVTAFIDYALIVVVILIIYYIFKFFAAAPPTKEERAKALEGQREAWKGFTKKAKDSRDKATDAAKEKEAKRQKKFKVSPAKGDLRSAMKAGDDMRVAISHGEKKTAKKLAKDIADHVKAVAHNLDLAAHGHEGEDRETLRKQAEAAHAARETFIDATKDKLKPGVDLADEATNLVSTINNLNGHLRAIWSALEKFHGAP
jgi:hypothetical protein